MIPTKVEPKQEDRIYNHGKCPKCSRILGHIWKFGKYKVHLCSRGCFEVILTKEDWDYMYSQQLADIPNNDPKICTNCSSVQLPKNLGIVCGDEYIFCFACGTLHIKNLELGFVVTPKRDNGCGGYLYR